MTWAESRMDIETSPDISLFDASMDGNLSNGGSEFTDNTELVLQTMTDNLELIPPAGKFFLIAHLY